jgi:hypothetical protein
MKRKVEGMVVLKAGSNAVGSRASKDHYHAVFRDTESLGKSLSAQTCASWYKYAVIQRTNSCQRSWIMCDNSCPFPTSQFIVSRVHTYLHRK